MCLALVLLAAPAGGAFAQEEESRPSVASEAEDAAEGDAWDEPALMGFGEFMRAAAVAGTYTLLSNVALMYINGLVFEIHWAFPSPASMRSNISTFIRGEWIWENRGGFLVNQFGHPVQGFTYFAAGRVAGLDFYGSIFWSAAGSFGWETFHANQPGSINDFISTTLAGVSLGEIMFRLHAQAISAGVPPLLAGLFNPVSGSYAVLSGRPTPAVPNNMHDFQARLSASYASTDYFAEGAPLPEREEIWNNGAFFPDLGIRAVYGDPFIQNTRVPYRHFEFDFFFGTDLSTHNDLRLFSDGYLLSFSPLHTETSALSHGLSLHYDLAWIGTYNLYNATINMYNNALAWTVKYRRQLSKNIAWSARAHAGATFFGVHKYLDTQYPPDYERERNSFGYGAMFKHLSTLDLNARARLDLNNFFYFQWPYPETLSPAEGFAWWQMHDASFSYLVSPGVSLGAAFSFIAERGGFRDFPSTEKNHWAARAFVAWNWRRDK